MSHRDHVGLYLGIAIGFLGGTAFGIFVVSGGSMPTKIEAAEHGYGQWCPDRSFAWQHEECE